MVAQANERADDMLTRIVNKTTDMADLVSVVGAVVGHVQVYMACPAGEALVTVAMINAPEVFKSNRWLGNEQIDTCELTIDVVSLVNTDAPIEEFVEKFIV